MFRSNSTLGNVVKQNETTEIKKKSGNFLEVNQPELRPFLSHKKANKSNLTVSFNGSHLSIVQNFDNTTNYINKPNASAFTQQRQLAWRPLITPKFVINLFLVSSVIFIPIGILLYFTSNNIYEFKYDYTDCIDFTSLNNKTCHEQMILNEDYQCTCRIYFKETRFQDETLFVYYMLENFYQNQRRYDKSRDSDQLLGSTRDYLSTDCEPFRYQKTDDPSKVLKISPCGAVANSIFNDTFNIFFIHKASNLPIKLNISKSNLAWDTDRQFKFRNPNDFINTVKPLNWAKNVSQLTNGYQNEDLMVWMRTSAFPTFKKLYGRILLEQNAKLAHKIPIARNDTSFHSFFNFRSQLGDYLKSFSRVDNKTELVYAISNTTVSPVVRDVEEIMWYKTFYRLPKGKYYIDINYRYLVKQMGGRKYLVLANVSWIGGRCYFMAISYIIVGFLCFLAAIGLFFIHVYHGNMDFNTAILMVDKTTGLVKC